MFCTVTVTRPSVTCSHFFWCSASTCSCNLCLPGKRRKWSTSLQIRDITYQRVTQFCSPGTNKNTASRIWSRKTDEQLEYDLVTTDCSRGGNRSQICRAPAWLGRWFCETAKPFQQLISATQPALSLLIGHFVESFLLLKREEINLLKRK